MSSIITPKQKDRLLTRPVDESDEEILKDRRLNDFYVRKALKRWIGSIQDINLALNTLPERQISELFKEGIKDEDVFVLLEIAERALVNLDFLPIQRNEAGKLIAVKNLVTYPVDGEGPERDFSIKREATDLDKDRFSNLQKHIARLEMFVKPQQATICNDLDRLYFKYITKIAKREGHEPEILPEQNRFLPRLTPEQYRFREKQALLIGLGVRHIEYPSDVETFKEAMCSDEGNALIKKFHSMQAEPPA